MTNKAYVKEVPFEHDWEFTTDGENWYTVVTTGTAAIKVYPPDPYTWDSDIDYYGYSESLGYEVQQVLKIDLEDNEEVFLPKISLDSKDYDNYINSLEQYIDKIVY